MTAGTESQDDAWWKTSKARDIGRCHPPGFLTLTQPASFPLLAFLWPVAVESPKSKEDTGVLCPAAES